LNVIDKLLSQFSKSNSKSFQNPTNISHKKAKLRRGNRKRFWTLYFTFIWPNTGCNRL